MEPGETATETDPPPPHKHPDTTAASLGLLSPHSHLDLTEPHKPPTLDSPFSVPDIPYIDEEQTYSKKNHLVSNLYQLAHITASEPDLYAVTRSRSRISLPGSRAASRLSLPRSRLHLGDRAATPHLSEHEMQVKDAADGENDGDSVSDRGNTGSCLGRMRNAVFCKLCR